VAQPQPVLISSFDPIVVPVTIYEVETPSPEENVAVALSGIAGAMQRDHWWYGHQRLRGSVKFGQIDFALIRRDRRTTAELFESEHNPLIWAALLLLRGSVREHAGTTRVRLVFMPGYMTLLLVFGMTVMATWMFVRLGFAGEMLIAPAFAWLAMLGVHRASIRLLRPHAFAALGLAAR
jgi:hypothetical protein